jgi:hypothetical protein
MAAGQWFLFVAVLPDRVGLGRLTQVNSAAVLLLDCVILTIGGNSNDHSPPSYIGVSKIEIDFITKAKFVLWRWIRILANLPEFCTGKRNIGNAFAGKRGFVANGQITLIVNFENLGSNHVGTSAVIQFYLIANLEFLLLRSNRSHEP